MFPFLLLSPPLLSLFLRRRLRLVRGWRRGRAGDVQGSLHDNNRESRVQVTGVFCNMAIESARADKDVGVMCLISDKHLVLIVAGHCHHAANPQT